MFLLVLIIMTYRFPREIIEKHWNEVMEVVIEAESRNESVVIIIGDLNHQVGKVVPGNTEKVTPL